MAPPQNANYATSLSSPAAINNNLAEHPLILHADEAFVVATPFLQWQAVPSLAPGGSPCMSIPHARAVKAIARRCSLSASATELAGFAMVDCFSFFLNAAAWQRIIDELLQSKLLAEGPFTSWPEFLSRLERLEWTNPSQLILTMSDFDLGESFDTPAVPGRPAARTPTGGRRRAQPAAPAAPAIAAQPAIPGPPDIAYLTLVTITTMVNPNANSPLANWCDLIGALGVGRTRVSRSLMVASVRTAGVMLATAVASRVLGTNTGSTPDALIAVHLPDMFQEIQLPRCLLPTELADSDLRAELRDSLRAARSEGERQAVEVARIHLTATRAPIFAAKIGRLAQSNAEIMQHLDRLYYTLQSAQGVAVPSSVTLIAKLDCVEASLAARVAALEEFGQRPNATAHSVVEAFIAERASANIMTPSARPAAEGATAFSGNADAEPDASAVYRAIALEQFRRMAHAVLSEADTRVGRLNAIAAGFDGNCVLAVRMLCEGSRTLSLKHPALARLFDLRPHLAEYFTWCLTAKKDGTVPSRLVGYSILGRPDAEPSEHKAGQTFLTQLLRFELDSIDWLSAPGGVLALKAAKDGGVSAARSTHPDDVYTIPEVVSEIGEFIHQLLVAMGASDNNPRENDEYSFSEWTQFYVRHLLMAKKLHTRELRLEHLDRCHEYFRAALRLYGQELKARVYCAQPDVKSIALPLMTNQDEPVISIQEWEASHETALDLLHKFRGMFGQGSSAEAAADLEDAWSLPKRSQRGKRGHDDKSEKSHKKEDSRKKPRAEKSQQPMIKGPFSPGSAIKSHMWLAGRSELYISGRIWKVHKLANKLKLKAGHAVCWPVILSARVGNNRLAHCEHVGQEGHETIDSAAHKIPGFRATALIEDDTLWRYPTDEEKEKLQQQQPQAAGPSNDKAAAEKRKSPRAKKQSNSKQTRGGQDFRSPSPPKVEEVTA